MSRFITTFFMMLLFAANAVLAGMNHCFCVVKNECGCELPPAETCGDDSHEHPSASAFTAADACDHAVIPALTLPDRWDDDDSTALPTGVISAMAPFPAKRLIEESGALRGQAPPLIPSHPNWQCFGIAIACRC